VSEAAPPHTADNAVRAFILLFVLGFVLRGIDVMDHDMWDAGQKWIIAAILAVVDFYYVPVRTSLGPRFGATAGKVATDFRWWTVAVLIILIWAGIAPAIERRGWPTFLLSKNAPSADEITRAVIRALPAQRPSPSPDEIAAAVVRQLPQSAAPSKAAPSVVPAVKAGPILIKNLQVGQSGDPQLPVVLVGNIGVNTDKLRVFVQYARGAGTNLSDPIPVGELKETVEGTSFSIPLVSAFTQNGKSTWYWGDVKNHRFIDEQERGVAHPLLIEILVLGPKNDEQRQKFLLWFVNIQNLKVPFISPSDQDLSRIKAWTQ